MPAIAAGRRRSPSSTRPSRDSTSTIATAIGSRMRLDDGEKVPREVQIVGVVGDVRHFGLEKEATIEVYVPIGQVPDPTTIWLANNMYWVIQTDGSAARGGQRGTSRDRRRRSRRAGVVRSQHGSVARWHARVATIQPAIGRCLCRCGSPTGGDRRLRRVGVQRDQFGRERSGSGPPLAHRVAT